MVALSTKAAAWDLLKAYDAKLLISSKMLFATVSGMPFWAQPAMKCPRSFSMTSAFFLLMARRSISACPVAVYEKVMDGIAEAHKATVAQVAINWSLAHDYIHTVLTGVGNAAEAEENCAAAAWELTAQEKQALDEAISKIHIYS